VSVIVAMGFSQQEAIDALQKNGDDLSSAVNSLLLS